jgi:hypothetical protein
VTRGIIQPPKQPPRGFSPACRTKAIASRMITYYLAKRNTDRQYNDIYISVAFGYMFQLV